MFYDNNVHIHISKIWPHVGSIACCFMQTGTIPEPYIIKLVEHSYQFMLVLIVLRTCIFVALGYQVVSIVL